MAEATLATVVGGGGAAMAGGGAIAGGGSGEVVDVEAPVAFSVPGGLAAAVVSAAGVAVADAVSVFAGAAAGPV